MGIFLLIILIFAVINILWYGNYNQYKELITDNFTKVDKAYTWENDYNYVFTVAKPPYLRYSGNVAITNEDDTVSILIWPEKFKPGEYEIGLQLYDEKTEAGYMFVVDKKMQYRDDPANDFSESQRTEILELLKRDKQELDYMYALAKEEWKFLY